MMNMTTVFNGQVKTEEKKSIICPNKTCGKVFDKALTTVNLQQDSKMSYSACPYCLTKIPVTEIQNPNSIEIPNTCIHYLGYLNEKEAKKQVPEECLVCSTLIECMHEMTI